MFNFLKRLFSEPVKTQELIAPAETLEERLRKSFIGLPIMLRSNENDPLLKGTISKFEKFRANNYVPTVKLENGDEVIAMSILLPYNEEVWKFLNQYDPKTQYKIMRELIVFHSTLRGICEKD